MKCDEYFNELKNDYEIIRVLSQKNESTVLLLRNRAADKKLVLRRYSAPVPAYDFLKTVESENLPIIYDSILLEDGQIVFEEYIDGITVADVVENGLYTYRGAKKVLIGVCDALALLQSNGFVHRDIKPENIMISKDSTVKLIDLNASRKYTPSAEKDTVRLGTLGYASPEQFGFAQSGVQTDIYALGVLLNVMLTGRHPSSFLSKGKAGKIVLKCTQIDPQSRFHSVEKLVAEL